MFVKNTLKLVVGNITAQVISLVAVPIITRIYSPSDYGIFGIYLSITTILCSVSTLHFHRALMLPENRNDAVNLLALSLLSVIGFSFLVTVGVVFTNLGIGLTNARLLEGMRCYLWLVPLGVCVQGCALSFTFWALRNKIFSNLAIARITESISDRGLVLATGFLTHAGAIGLIGGRIVGPLLAQCYLVQQTVKSEIKVLWRSLSFPEMLRLARRYREFSLFSSLSIVVWRASTEIPLLFIAFFFSPTVVGFYVLAMRVINMPMLLIGDAVSNAFLQRATGETVKEASLAIDTTRLFSRLIYLVLPPVLIILLFGKSLFGLVFGSEWSEAGVYAQILSISFFFQFLHRPLSTLFDVYERQKQKLVVYSLLLIMCPGAVILGYITSGSCHITLLVLSLTASLIYAGSYFYLFGLVGVSNQNVFRILVNKIVVMVPLTTALVLSKIFIHRHFLIFSTIITFLLILQWIFLSKFDPLVKNELVSCLPTYFKLKVFRRKTITTL
jgi:O-antigen/teichoic acid export membrane protein